jgi:radical SAM superfamily enzyme YgiQ (UPF0313 family)
MNILLIYPSDREFMPPSMPPLGLAYIASTLLQAGHRVNLIDLNCDREHGLTRLQDALQNETFGMIGISSIITQFKKVKELGALVKKLQPHTPLVLGGAGPTSMPELYLDRCGGDIVCIGEGELTVKELVSLLQSNAPLDSCAGIVFRGPDGSFVATTPRGQIQDIDSLPFPSWESFGSIAPYVDNYLFRAGKENGISIFSTRGCPGQCNYCMCNFGRKLRFRSAENIFGEIAHAVAEYGVKHIHFVDDTFVTAHDRVRQVCAGFKSRFPELTWSANVRANLVNADILQEMAAANCISLAYGIESGSPQVLRYMKKGVTPEQARNAITWTRDAGIALTCYFMIGMPCETPETISETVEFCKANLVGGEFFFVTPLPGTELYRHALQNGIITNEELYLEHVGEIRNFLVNMTTMSTDQLFDLKEQAESAITDHLKNHGMAVKQSIRENPRETVASLPRF